MAEPTLADRVQVLESKVENLEKLPARLGSLELQVLQFQKEVRAEFSAVRSELRAEIHELGVTLRGEMHTLGEGLRREMRELNDQTNTHMRVLHEEVLSRIALLDEHRDASARSRRLSKTRPRQKKG